MLPYLEIALILDGVSEFLLAIADDDAAPKSTDVVNLNYRDPSKRLIK